MKLLTRKVNFLIIILSNNMLQKIDTKIDTIIYINY